MINLLPTSAIKRIITEYRIRLATTALFMLGVIIFIALVLLTPSYFLASHKKSVVESDLSSPGKSNSESAQEQKKLEDMIRESESVLGLLGGGGKQITPSDAVIAKIVGYKTNSITLNAIFYEAQDTGGYISLKGVATSRQSLIMFADSLKKDITFTNVNLPISGLVKDSNIDFTITLNLKGEEKKPVKVQEEKKESASTQNNE